MLAGLLLEGQQRILPRPQEGGYFATQVVLLSGCGCALAPQQVPEPIHQQSDHFVLWWGPVWVGGVCDALASPPPPKATPGVQHP